MAEDTEILENQFDSMELNSAKNGFIITVRTEDDETDYVFDSHQKTIRFIKKLITPEK